jgi:peptidoglycan biosynthesis protein MviN/MurJ (putative lipid II flippase)
MSVAQGNPGGHWYSVPVRALFVSFLLTLMSFAVTLFFTILGTVIAAALRHSRPDLPYAYRHIALPVALGVGIFVLVISLITEIRHLRQTRTLAGIARASR